MPVPTLLHAHKCLMRNARGNVNSSLSNPFQLALQLVPWKKNKDFGLSQPLVFANSALVLSLGHSGRQEPVSS